MDNVLFLLTLVSKNMPIENRKVFVILDLYKTPAFILGEPNVLLPEYCYQVRGQYGRPTARLSPTPCSS